MKHSLKAALGAMALALAVGSPSAHAKTTLRVAHALSPNEPIHHAVEKFAEAVTKRTKGEVRISIFPSEQLGPNREVYEQVRQGAPIIQVADPAFMADYVPDLGVMNGPYLLDEPLQFQKLLDSDWYAEMQTPLQKAGFRVLSFNYFFGIRNVIADKPVRSPADFNGMTIRIAPNPMWVETFKALGARGTPMPWTEVYSALAQGVVDAVEAPLGSLVGSKLQEQRKTMSLTGHFTAYLGLVMNEKQFQALSPEHQQILIEESQKAGEEMTRVTLENDKKLQKDLEAQGINIVRDIDIQAMRDATAPVYSAFPDWTPGLYQRIRAILD
ncbi:C4-dicarboxylate TRAP transporter substrate-binding protein [Paracandidimonas soli]|uniref:C4-dicarboxylate TRAP transporter substrate-binding protein n=1 Tax=Paracandidimonas soli TaxID=1917182 RepID=UPI003342538E